MTESRKFIRATGRNGDCAWLDADQISRVSTFHEPRFPEHRTAILCAGEEVLSTDSVDVIMKRIMTSDEIAQPTRPGTSARSGW